MKWMWICVAVLVSALVGCTSAVTSEQRLSPAQTPSSSPDRAQTVFCTAFTAFSPQIGYLSGPYASLHGGGLVLQGITGVVAAGRRNEAALRRAAKMYAAAGDTKAAKSIVGVADDFAAMLASAGAIAHTAEGLNSGNNFHRQRRELASTGTALLHYE
jgi:hypothetical protein